MPVDPLRHLFTVEEFQEMGRAGLFPPERRLELLDGEVYEMAPIGPRHAGTVDRLTELFVRGVGLTGSRPS